MRRCAVKDEIRLTHDEFTILVTPKFICVSEDAYVQGCMPEFIGALYQAQGIYEEVCSGE
jgi:hypothetical protein